MRSQLETQTLRALATEALRVVAEHDANDAMDQTRTGGGPCVAAAGRRATPIADGARTARRRFHEVDQARDRRRVTGRPRGR